MPELNPAQFTDIYHGTTSGNAKLIQESGLHPSEWNPSVMTVAFDPKTAEDYAHDAADYYRDRLAIVHMRVPTKEWDEKYMGDHEEHGWGVAAGLKDTVPGEYVHKVIPLKKQRGGYYDASGR